MSESNVSESQDDLGDESKSDKQPLHWNKSYSICNRIWKLIPMFLKMSDEQLRVKCGPDAVTYCQFQRYLMVIVSVMMCFSLILILPLNLSGGLLYDSSDFSTLTIANVRSSNPALWVHFTVALTLMLFAFFLSTRFLQKIDVKDKAMLSSTIMITNIPENWCDELSIQSHFQEAFPSVKVLKVQVAHRVDRLIYVDAEKKCAEDALEYCCNELESNGQPIMVVPHCCGRRMVCKCCTSESCVPVDGVAYYRAEVIRLSNLFIEEKSRAVNDNKLPIAFVTFDNVQQSMLVRQDYIYQNYCCVNTKFNHTSRLSKEMRTSQWKVAFAPMVEDILWQNLHKRGWKWWLPVILANLVVIITVIILATPTMILNLIDRFKINQKLRELNNPILIQFVPSLILLLVNSLMPTLVYWSDQLSGHWSKTSQNRAVMNKLYAILVTNVLIMPSLGLNGIPEMMTWLFPVNSTNTTFPDKFKWECIFMPDGGALFCNYLITASFIGTALELLRFGELFLFSCKMCFSKSRADDQSIAKKIVWEFQFGLGYAWTLAFFTMISAYAVIVPIITPFGLVYLLLKHAVDRYNLIHVNSYSLVHNTVHSNAAQLMHVGLVLTQATVTIYVTLRRGVDSPLSICCYIAFVVGLLLTFGRTTQRWIKSMACVKYSFAKPRSDSVEKDNNSDSIILDDDDFILVDNVRQSSFVPRQLTNDDSTNIVEPRWPESVLSTPSPIESPSHLPVQRNHQM